MTLMQEIFSRELRQNQLDSGSAVGKTASFYRVILNYRVRSCPKPACNTIPILQQRTAIQGPSKEGKKTFVGCSMRDNTNGHWFASIPADVEEKILKAYLDGSALPSSRSCYACGGGWFMFSLTPHLVDGKIVTGIMVLHPCPTTKAVYTSKDPNIFKCVVIFRGRHSHPSWPLEKPGAEALDDVKKCFVAGGGHGQTGGRLNDARTTKALLGTSLDVKHPALRDGRRIWTETMKLRVDENPEGLFWAAMDPELGALLHDAGVRYIMGDITFKRTKVSEDEKGSGRVAANGGYLARYRGRKRAERVFGRLRQHKGEFNEWGGPSLVYRHLRTSHYYSDIHQLIDKGSIVHLFDAFFTTVKNVTGKPLRFKVFYEKGNIFSIHFDMEAVQVQGLGVSLSKIVSDDPDLRTRFPVHDPDTLVQYVVKLCSVHFERSTDALVSAIGQEAVDYLNHFRGLSDPVDIENWHQFYWYKHKIQYPWLLPGFNKSLSLFPPGYWHQSPSHTNLVESGHVATNRATSINLPPLKSIRRVRIARVNSTGRRPPPSRLRARPAFSQIGTIAISDARMYRKEHDVIYDTIAEDKRKLAAITEEKKAIAARLKDLNAKKKEMGWIPCHSTSRSAASTSAIPRFIGHAENSSSENSDSNMELDFPAPASLFASTSLVPSSPVDESHLSSGPVTSPFSSPVPMLRPVTESDGVDTLVTPDYTLSESELDALLALPSSDVDHFFGTDNGFGIPSSDSFSFDFGDTFNFGFGDQTNINTDFVADLFTNSGIPPVQSPDAPAPLQEWPLTLPPTTASPPVPTPDNRSQYSCRADSDTSPQARGG
ncbi:hypothetical protein B0H14DRAFT_3783557 [Mycena olivaceomarginata]|nr:hypothetical protein B0H14DRAFT_3783557 [Mycena olivaceomarginata]